MHGKHCNGMHVVYRQGCLIPYDGESRYLSDLEEKGLQQNIEFGYDERYSATDIGTITFQRESGSPLRMIDVLYVVGLKNNLVFVAVLEYHGYDLMFRKGKVFLRHTTTGRVRHIGVTVKNLYALKVEDEFKALRRKVEVIDLVFEREHKLPLDLQNQK